jgi:hypothetical protein
MVNILTNGQIWRFTCTTHVGENSDSPITQAATEPTTVPRRSSRTNNGPPKQNPFRGSRTRDLDVLNERDMELVIRLLVIAVCISFSFDVPSDM